MAQLGLRSGCGSLGDHPRSYGWELRSSTRKGAIGVALVNVLSFNQTLVLFIASWMKPETSLGAIARLKAFERDTASEFSSHETHESSVPPEN